MTIEFPKFPIKKRSTPPLNDNSGHNPNANEQALTLEPMTVGLPDSMSAEKLTDLKATLTTAPLEKPKKNKRLPIILGVLLLGGIGAIAYPMYQQLFEEKTVATAAVKDTTTKVAQSTIDSKPAMPTPASSSATTATVASPPQVGSSAAAIINASSATAAISHTATAPVKEEDLQKPLLVDNIPSNTPKTPLNNDTLQPAQSDTNTNIKADTKQSDTKIDMPSRTIATQNEPTVKAATGKAAVSYDEFVKASDTAVFIEPPSKAK